MEEELISLETAMLAKEKGFNEGSYHLYTYPNNELKSFQALNYNAEQDGLQYEAPTQSLLQKWLREKHNIEIECYRTMETVEGYNYGCQGENWNDDLTEDMFNFYGKTYEETLEKGLQEALNLIK